MSARRPAPPALRDLSAIGGTLRRRRQALQLAAAATARSAGISRATLYRAESGNPSVTIGAYASLAAVLGLRIEVADTTACPADAVPGRHEPETRVSLSQYGQLRAIAWNLADDTTLTEEEALSLYERLWRHVDQSALTDDERAFIASLATRFGGGVLLV
ncbi:helix-turn-helix domain-containing protein [Gordonia alkaliphila]|uniref:helix-turn-helix domain-containing protein n=1 Tax=Gordonia alkaliphila TaxID=1053547 RepID=UPI001FF5945F|nr:helix-turn-helix domain-containing protein [Gordonia alkaliphila]MCK0441117.1 helix-turn-helix domain-containing protein [Gordonia alkaliphila]